MDIPLMVELAIWFVVIVALVELMVVLQSVYGASKEAKEFFRRENDAYREEAGQPPKQPDF